VVSFRCPHRGLQLSVGWVEDDSIRCRYHGWKYDSSGQCVEVPTEPESTAKTIRIRSYPAVEYLGFVFAFFGEAMLPRYRAFRTMKTAKLPGRNHM
jgi:5,5'-dehydrodivanillate O-demethylase